jgi:putative intracellular protease/amidase
VKILMVLTSHDQLGNTGRKTGIWLEEFAAPYFVFRDAEVEMTLASPKGGQPPIDPKSDLPENQTPAMTRYKKDSSAQKAFASTIKLAEMKSENFDTVFYSGGHGPMWDLAESPASIALLESFFNYGKPIALVCHAPGVLRHVMYQGEPLVKGKRVTGFTNGEEEEVQLTKVVPFLVEDELLRLGATFEKLANWQPFAVVDGRLVTGQNPASSTYTAKALMNLLARETQNNRVALDRHWAASASGDLEAEHQIYDDHVVCEYPQSEEKIRGRRNLQALRGHHPEKPSGFLIRRIVGLNDLWVTEYVIKYTKSVVLTVSIMEFQNGKVIHETQYFCEPFDAPAWRSQWVEKGK